MKTVPQ